MSIFDNNRKSANASNKMFDSLSSQTQPLYESRYDPVIQTVKPVIYSQKLIDLVAGNPGSGQGEPLGQESEHVVLGKQEQPAVKSEKKQTDNVSVNLKVIQKYDVKSHDNVIFDKDNKIQDVHIPNSWRVDGSSNEYTNNHTVAYTLLCEAAKQLIVRKWPQEAIDTLNGYVGDYYELIVGKNCGRTRASNNEANQVHSKIESLNGLDYDPLHLYKYKIGHYLHGLLHLQQNYKPSFHMKGGGEETAAGEAMGIKKLRKTRMDFDQKAYLEPVAEDEKEKTIDDFVEALLPLVDVRKVLDKQKSEIFLYMYDIVEQLFHVYLNSEKEDEETNINFQEFLKMDMEKEDEKEDENDKDYEAPSQKVMMINEVCERLYDRICSIIADEAEEKIEEEELIKEAKKELNDMSEEDVEDEDEDADEDEDEDEAARSRKRSRTEMMYRKRKS